MRIKENGKPGGVSVYVLRAGEGGALALTGWLLRAAHELTGISQFSASHSCHQLAGVPADSKSGVLVSGAGVFPGVKCPPVRLIPCYFLCSQEGPTGWKNN